MGMGKTFGWFTLNILGDYEFKQLISTGAKDIVTHKVDGYKEESFIIDDLSRGIEWILNNKNYNKLCQGARKKVVREFDSVVVAKKYIELYKDTSEKVPQRVKTVI